MTGHHLLVEFIAAQATLLGRGLKEEQVKRNVLMFLTAIGGLLLAAPAFAQEATAKTASGGVNWVALTSGFAMAIASAVCGYAQSKATAAACEGLARNPGARPGIQLALILALIFIESLALYTLAIIFLKVV
jgi:F-type H+-transporting ATPase subunit c